jgi:hypothetical protein
MTDQPTEQDQAKEDAKLYGMGFLIDGKRVMPKDVTMFVDVPLAQAQDKALLDQSVEVRMDLAKALSNPPQGDALLLLIARTGNILVKVSNALASHTSLNLAKNVMVMQELLKAKEAFKND